MVLDNAPQLIEQEPKKYLSLFPTAESVDVAPSCLTDVVRASFGNDQWLLKLYDLWKVPFVLQVGPGSATFQLEKVPEWLAQYKEAFRDLTTDARRFVAWTVGGAVDDRLGYGGNVSVKKTGADVPDRVLLAGQSPRAEDLQKLLKLLGEEQLDASSLQGRWALQREGADESLLRFDSDCLYLVRTKQTPPLYAALDVIGIHLEKAEWVAPEVGLSALQADVTRELLNVQDADETGAVELLRRTGSESRHDFVSDHHKIVPVVDFLCSQSTNRLTENLRLAFLVKTAAVKLDRRHLGVVFLRPERPTPDEDLWQGLLRQTFAEVDPQFTPHLRRLLGHAPQLLTSLGDDVCRVTFARGDLLDLLHDIRAWNEGFVGRLTEQLNQISAAGEDRRSQVNRAARLAQ